VEDAEILTDAESGLHVSWYFWLRVLDEVNRSARYGSPFALLVLDVVGTGASRRVRHPLSKVAPAIRVTDLGGRLGAQQAAVLLLEQDRESALSAATRITAALGSQSVEVASRLLCYPEDAAEISRLLAAGRAGSSIARATA
jgi:PleD family two-component response regulator